MKDKSRRYKEAIDWIGRNYAELSADEPIVQCWPVARLLAEIYQMHILSVAIDIEQTRIGGMSDGL